jgi:hypothetical protein
MSLRSWATYAVMAVLLTAPMAAADDGDHDCKAWTAAVQEREEGPALTAMACAKTDTHDAILEIVCFGEEVNIRYIHAPDKGADEFGPKRDFLFITNKGRRAVFMTFEGLDGAFTAYLDKEHPLFELLMESRTLSVEDPTHRLKSRKITLKDSRDAITSVIETCKPMPAAPAPEPCATAQPASTSGAAQASAPGAAPAQPTAPAGDATPRTSGATGPSGDRR